MNRECPNTTVLSDLVLGLLPEPRALLVRAHLDRCGICSQVIAELLRSSGRFPPRP